MAAKSDASDGAAPNRPPIAPARAVVLTSLFQLVPVAMNLRLRHRRSLRAIERNLADCDPSLTKLFSTFTVLAQGEERGTGSVTPHRLIPVTSGLQMILNGVLTGSGDVLTCAFG